MGPDVRLDEQRDAAPEVVLLRRRAVDALALVVAGGACLLAHQPTLEQDLVLGMLVCAVTVTLVATGVLLAHEPAQRVTARLFLLAGVLWSLTWLAPWETGPWPALANVGAVYAAVGAWGFLRYPGRRLETRLERAWVTALVCWLGLGRLVLVVLAEPSWLYPVSGDVWWPPSLADRRLFTPALVVYNAVAAVLALAFPFLYLARFRRLTGLDRRVLQPVAVAAVVSCAGTAAVAVHKAVAVAPVAPVVTYRVLGLALLAVPLAFLAAVVRRQLAFAGLSRLVGRISGSSSAADVQEALQEAMGDDSLQVHYWLPGEVGYVDALGRPVPADARPGTVVQVLDSTGGPLARVVAHEDLQRHGDLLGPAVKACGLALENARLAASLRAQVREVQASRERIVEAAVAERRRLERDLHDGAQQRLLALNLHLSAAQVASADTGAVAALAEAKSQLREALAELRELAHGIHPALLTQSGLAAAVAAVAERLPLQVDVAVPEQRFAPAVESTVYYVVCEALTNSVKHAGASRAAVRLHAQEQHLVLSVSDDGCGGASLDLGRGLAGLDDRVRALGGRLMLRSRPGEGTTVSATVPCG